MHHQKATGSRGRRETKVAFMVLGYKPPSNWITAREWLCEFVDQLIFIQNQAEADTTATLSAGMLLIKNSANLGVAAAHNLAADTARQHGCSHLIISDQDSQFSHATLLGLLRHIESYSGAAVLASPYRAPSPLKHIGRWPTPALGRWGFKLVSSNSIDQATEIMLAISSGSAINLNIHRALGGFKDRLFIDLVDTEYCLRARTRGYQVLGIPIRPLAHQIGQPQHRNLCGISVYPTHHSWQRHYTLARNRVVLSRDYALKLPGWFAYEWLAALKLTLKVMLFEKQRGAKLAAILKGTLAGITFKV